MTDARSSLGPNLDRRTFVQGAAAVAASGAIGSTSMAARRRHRRDPIRVGLIGCGGRGTGAAFQAMTADAGAVLWAMGDVFPERITSSHQNLRNAMQSEADDRVQVPAERQFVGFDAYQQVIDSGVDVVILTTPPGFRPAHLEAAIAAGKHVFT